MSGHEAREAQEAQASAAGRAVVVKLGGTTVAEQDQVLDEIAAVAREQPVVVVHGGGNRVTEWLGRLGIASRFEHGLRVTDAPALEAAAAVLRGVINVELVAALRGRGADAVGLSGVDGGIFVGERVPELGYVARVTGIRRPLLDELLGSGRVPVVAPLALDERGALCNVNADEAAAGLALGLRAEALVLLTDTDGVRGADGARLPRIGAAEAERLIERGVVAGGMVPKVRTALAALAAGGAGGQGDGAGRAVIADGSAADALRRALGDEDFGTRLEP